MATDYDAYDAILHHIFREASRRFNPLGCPTNNIRLQTQGDAWFKPLSENLAAGVCLRVAEPTVPSVTLPGEGVGVGFPLPGPIGDSTPPSGSGSSVPSSDPTPASSTPALLDPATPGLSPSPQALGTQGPGPQQQRPLSQQAPLLPRAQYRVFPYENLTLAPFEAAVRSLNPVVAVKVRNAAVHAALGSV